MMKRDIEKEGSLFGRIGEAAMPRFYRQSGVSLLHSISENLITSSIPAPAVVLALRSWALLI